MAKKLFIPDIKVYYEIIIIIIKKVVLTYSVT